jgi:hypothetical protein
MQEKDDHFALWMSCGFIGIIIAQLYSLTAKIIGLQKHFIWNIAAGMFVGKDQAYTFLGIILGILTNFVMSGIISYSYGLFIEWRGNKHYILKGISFGIIAWLFDFGMLAHMLPLTMKELPTDALSYLSSFVAHSIYGSSLALAYKFLFRVKNSSAWR